MDFLIACFFIVATGFVAAGLLESFSRLISKTPLGFDALAGQGAGMVLSVSALVIAGPVILMAEPLRTSLREHRLAERLGLASVLAFTWSFFSGLFILNVVIAAGGLA